MALFLRLLPFLLFIAILYLLYRGIKFITHPMRKLELAYEQKKFYFYDDPNNVRKNFHITYKGALFEGEKYLGTTEHAFDVVSIFVFPKKVDDLKGLTYEDFVFLEREIQRSYPNAKIDWKSPVKELLQKHRS
ncbi:sigma-w pathway protein ysdB [Aeribacillus pallidus]|uniref:sigma-w pathway protein ysdB n=1 Tax=Aeribacillus pallidus TaxID=33936 RepID=UPI003D24992B